MLWRIKRKGTNKVFSNSFIGTNALVKTKLKTELVQGIINYSGAEIFFFGSKRKEKPQMCDITYLITMLII